MSCTIKFNNEGKIKTVLTPQGVESKLFKQIARLPHVSSLEEALDIFKNVYSESMQAKEPIVEAQKEGITIDESVFSKYDSLRKNIDDAPTSRIKNKNIQELKNFLTQNMASIESKLQENNVLNKEC